MCMCMCMCMCIYVYVYVCAYKCFSHYFAETVNFGLPLLPLLLILFFFFYFLLLLLPSLRPSLRLFLNVTFNVTVTFLNFNVTVNFLKAGTARFPFSASARDFDGWGVKVVARFNDRVQAISWAFSFPDVRVSVRMFSCVAKIYCCNVLPVVIDVNIRIKWVAVPFELGNILGSQCGRIETTIDCAKEVQ